jgi:hypothetical protein
VIKKDRIDLGAVVFCLVKENLIIFGRENDLVLYDRIAQKELYSIFNISFTTNWREIRMIPHPYIDSNDFTRDKDHWYTFY